MNPVVHLAPAEGSGAVDVTLAGTEVAGTQGLMSKGLSLRSVLLSCGQGFR